MTEHSQETKVAILEAKVDHMVGHVTELTKRVRAVEKVCAIVSAIGIGAGGIVGTTVFNAPKAEAQEYPEVLYSDNTRMAQQWINSMRNWKAEKERTPVEEMLNSALVELEWPDGSDDTPKPEIVLQFPSDQDRQSAGWGHDRRDHRSWFRPLQKGTGTDSGS